jgi:hypothetical protein
MTYRILLVAAIGLFWLSSSAADSRTANAGEPDTQLPASVSRFRDQVKDLGPKQVLAAAIAQFGKPTRDLGSGLSIPQWDVAGGTLTVHPGRGPTFQRTRGPVVWLIPTANRAGDQIAQGFEMYSPPDPANHGNQFWIGNVHVSPGMKYEYVDSGSNLQERGNQSRNFFILHPAGRAKIAWSKGVDAGTLLETAGDGEICRVTFTENGGEAAFEAAIVSSAQERQLTIAGPTFVMSAGWLHFWPDPAR